MKTTIITISSPEYMIESMRADWADDPDLSPAMVNACADEEYAYLVNHAHEMLRGWTYTGTGFTGPARNDALQLIGELRSAAIDHVLSNLGEIREELDAE